MEFRDNADKWLYKDIVQTAQQNVCLNDGNIEMIITKDLQRNPNDDAHYIANGMTELGIRFAKAMLKLQNKNESNENTH